MSEDPATKATSESAEVAATSPTDLVDQTGIRFPKAHRSDAAERDDVEGHEFEEEDPLERMVHIVLPCM